MKPSTIGASEAARRLGVSRRTILRWIRNGRKNGVKLAATKTVGGHARIELDRLRAWAFLEGLPYAD